MTVKQLILVGRSGNGKTSCLETITNIQNSNVSIQVSECKGVGDTGEDLSGDIEDVLKNLEGQIRNFQRYGGIDSFALVLKYGVRFTQQEKKAVEVIKLIFGDDVFKNWGVVIFTCGDVFPLVEPGDDIHSAFMRWCKDQTGDIQKLFEEVDYRCVLLDNRTQRVDKIKLQVNELENTVNKAISKKQFEKYDMVKYERARPGRKELILRGKPERKDKSTKKFSCSTLCLFITWICLFSAFLVLEIFKHVWSGTKRILTPVWELVLTTFKRFFPTAYALLLEYCTFLIIMVKKIIHFLLTTRLKKSEQNVP